MVQIGIVGIGFMGMIHYLAAQRGKGAKVAAVCSRDQKKLAGDWTSIHGNFGPKGTTMDLSGHKKYADVEQLLKDPEIDLVDLCVPNDAHAKLAIRALEAGKHVLVEKPIALTLSEADAMLDAARAHKKLLMVGHVLPFFPEFAFVVEAVNSGRYGALRAAHFSRIISKPDWSSGIADVERSGGPAVDLHIHDTHFIGLLCGVPRAVASRGVQETGAMAYLTTHYIYDDSNLAVSCVSGALSQAGRPFTHGFEIYLERATLAFEFATLGGEGHVATPLSVILPSGEVERPALGSGDPIDSFAGEIGVAAAGAASGVEPPQLSGKLARQALGLCLAEIESARSGQVVSVV